MDGVGQDSFMEELSEKKMLPPSTHASLLAPRTVGRLSLSRLAGRLSALDDFFINSLFWLDAQCASVGKGGEGGMGGLRDSVVFLPAQCLLLFGSVAGRVAPHVSRSWFVLSVEFSHVVIFP